MRKEHNHHFEAVTYKVFWYCVFALRDLEGEVISDLYSTEHDPMSGGAVEYDYWTKRDQLDTATMQYLNKNT